MIVYHGSDTVVDRPLILKAKRPLDFGGGFYVTSNKDQADSWATKVAYRNASRAKSVNVYDFDYESAKRDLIILHFDKADEGWLDFICSNRQMRCSEDYDIVIGPVADDRVYRVVVEYENGDIDKATALKNLKTEKLCDQILFHTERSLSYIKYIETEVSHYERA